MQERDIIRILGVNIDNITKEEMGKKISELVKKSNKSCKYVVSPNTEFIMTAWKDRDFWEILNKADLSTPDSIGISIGGKIQKKPFKARIPGQEVFRKAIEVGEKEDFTFYFLGGENGIAEKARDNVLKDYPNAKIVGCHEGFFKNNSEKEVVEEINRLQPNILFVATGHPRQEKWIYAHKNELKVDLAFGQRTVLLTMKLEKYLEPL